MGPETILGAALSADISPTKNRETPNDAANNGRVIHSAPVPKPHMRKTQKTGTANRVRYVVFPVIKARVYIAPAERMASMDSSE